LLPKNSSVSVKCNSKTEEVSLDFVSNGNFEPVQELKFSAEKSGKITKILAKEGDYVSVGQTLLLFARG
jgi:multidrug efflux pump subunit AcrA (membrane-fusion protein)